MFLVVLYYVSITLFDYAFGSSSINKQSSRSYISTYFNESIGDKISFVAENLRVEIITRQSFCLQIFLFSIYFYLLLILFI